MMNEERTRAPILVQVCARGCCTLRLMRLQVFRFFAAVSLVILLLAAGVWSASLIGEPTLTRTSYEAGTRRTLSVSVNADAGRLLLWRQEILWAPGQTPFKDLRDS